MSAEHAREPQRRCIASKYDLLELLGEGGFGSVWRARHRWTKRECAVKLLHDDLNRKNDAVLRFMREAQSSG